MTRLLSSLKVVLARNQEEELNQEVFLASRHVGISLCARWTATVKRRRRGRKGGMEEEMVANAHHNTLSNH